jgi:hypothetical protein
MPAAGVGRARARGDEASGSVYDDIDGNEIVTVIAPVPKTS